MVDQAEFEGRTPGSSTVTGVTLTATRSMDSTLRRILNLSFGLIFPQDGGVGEQRAQVILRKAEAKRAR